MLFVSSKAALALLCFAGYSSAFALPAIFDRGVALCLHAKEGASCAGLPAIENWGCSLNMWDIITCENGVWVNANHYGAPICNCRGSGVPGDPYLTHYCKSQ